jgi:putative membrane protein
VDAVFQSFLAGFPVFIAHFALTIALLVVGITLYVLITPHREMRLIRAGNTAAAISLGGVLIGLGLPLAVSMANSVTLFDVLVWGVVSLALQLVTFFVIDFLLRGLPKRIEEGEVASAIFLAGAKLAVAMVMAAALT